MVATDQAALTMYDSILNAQHDRLHQDMEEIARADSFRIFTSFRLNVLNDPAETKAKLYQQDQSFPFSLHRDRLIRSAEAFGWSHVVDWISGSLGLQRLADTVASEVSRNIASGSSACTFKVRLTISRDVVIGVECIQLETGIHPQTDCGIRFPKQLVIGSTVLGSCRVMLDTQPTYASLFTAHKTTARTPYNNARERANISEARADHGEVLLFNLAYEIMEASISTPYFHRTGRWVTPPLSSGGNAGVSRYVALDRGLCVEEIVKIDSLRDGETVWISNCVRGFIMGTLNLPGCTTENP